MDSFHQFADMDEVGGEDPYPDKVGLVLADMALEIVVAITLNGAVEKTRLVAGVARK